VKLTSSRPLLWREGPLQRLPYCLPPVVFPGAHFHRPPPPCDTCYPQSVLSIQGFLTPFPPLVVNSIRVGSRCLRFLLCANTGRVPGVLSKTPPYRLGPPLFRRVLKVCPDSLCISFFVAPGVPVIFIFRTPLRSLCLFLPSSLLDHLLF